MSEARKLTMPLWVAHARDDAFTDHAGSVALVAEASTTDKVLVDDIDGADHMLAVVDMQRYDCKYAKQLIAWLDDRITGGVAL